MLLESNNYVVEAEDPAHADLRRPAAARHRRLPDRRRHPGAGLPRRRHPRRWPPSSTRTPSRSWSGRTRSRGSSRSRARRSSASSTPSPIPNDNEVLPEGTPQIRGRSSSRRFFEGDTAAIAARAAQAGRADAGALLALAERLPRVRLLLLGRRAGPTTSTSSPAPTALSRGDKWMTDGRRTGTYIPDNRRDSRLLSYDDLFQDWEKNAAVHHRGPRRGGVVMDGRRDDVARHGRSPAGRIAASAPPARPARAPARPRPAPQLLVVNGTRLYDVDATLRPRGAAPRIDERRRRIRSAGC